MSRLLTTAEFILKAKTKHNDYYTYEKTVYINGKHKVIITCPIHGDFEQTPGDHTQGHGCPKCKATKTSLSAKTTEQFIKEAIDKHNNFYTYNNTQYSTCDDKITITCPIHGDFTQRPANHLRGIGCPECGKLKKVPTWSYTDWETAGHTSKYFTGFKLYIIECWNDTERFIKIGKTFTPIDLRFRGTHRLPYDWKLLQVFEGNANYISTLETIILADIKNYKYQPSITFGGSHECFTLNTLNYLHTKVYNDTTVNIF